MLIGTGAKKIAERLGVEEKWLHKAAGYWPDKAYQDATIAFIGLYLMTWEGTESITDRIARPASDDAKSVIYQGLGGAPRMREQGAEREPSNLLATPPFLVETRSYEASIEVPITDLIADRLGQYPLKIAQMAANAKRHPDELILKLIRDAASSLCYDGQNLCDTGHSEGASGTQVNQIACSGDDTTAHIITDLASATAGMLGFLDDRGEPLDIGGGPETVYDVFCRPVARDLFNQVNVATQFGAITPSWTGRLRIHTSGRLTTANRWWLAYAGGLGRPIIVQYQTGGQPSDLQAIDSPTAEHAIKHGTAFFGVKGQYTVVPGDWRYIVQVGL